MTMHTGGKSTMYVTYMTALWQQSIIFLIYMILHNGGKVQDTGHM